ncbi:unnamed protein product, partial [Mesorhabditis spiculigera]
MKLTKFLRFGNKKGAPTTGKEYSDLGIEAKVDQLERLRRLNDALVAHSIGISQRYYDETAAVCHVIIEHLSAGLQMMSMSSTAQNPEFSKFLAHKYELLDQIGLEQRRFYFNIQEKVILTLREWRNGDYNLIRSEVNKLSMYRKKLLTHKYNDASIQHQVLRERLQSEHDKQLLLVMNLLAGIDRVQYTHFLVICDLVTIVVEYGRAVERILEPTADNETPLMAN